MFNSVWSRLFPFLYEVLNPSTTRYRVAKARDKGETNETSTRAPCPNEFGTGFWYLLTAA